MGTKIELNIPDYIYQQAQEIAKQEKRSISDVFHDVLIQTFPATYVSLQRKQMEREQSAFWDMYESLLSKYATEYVAICNGQLIDHDPNRLALASRIDEKYPYETVLIKLVSPEADPVIQVRSPRIL